MYATLHYIVSNCGPRELHANDQNAAPVEFPSKFSGTTTCGSTLATHSIKLRAP